MVLVQIDTGLNILRYDTIVDTVAYNLPQYFHGYEPRGIKVIGDFIYITGALRYPFQKVESFLLKMNKQGQVIWEERYRYKNIHNIGTFDVIPLGIDSLLLVSEFNPYLTDSAHVGNILRLLDANGQYLDSAIYIDPYFYNSALSGHEMRDGSIVIAGQYVPDYRRSYVWKLNKNLDPIWRHSYYHGDIEDNSCLYHIHEWSDGSILASGYYFDRHECFMPADSCLHLWLLSMDTAGCYGPGLCGQPFSVEELQASHNQQLKIYPNPNQGLFTLELADLGGPVTLYLYDIAGRVVYQTTQTLEAGKTEVQLKPLPAGTYFLQVKNQERLFVKKLMIQP
jgi:hypothetical protein